MNPIFVVGGIMVLIIFVTMIYIVSRLKKCPPNKIMVIYGRIIDEKDYAGFRLIHSGAFFVWPVIQNYAFLDLADYEHKIEAYFKGKDHKDVFVKGKLSYRISSEDTLAKNASERLLNKSREDIKKLTSEYVEDAIRSVFMNMTENEARGNNREIYDLTKSKIDKALKPLGMVSNHLRIEVS